MENEFVSRREFDQHLKQAAETQGRIDGSISQLREDIRFMDDHGTRGVQTLQATVTALATSLGEMKGSFTIFQEKHDRLHEREEGAREADLKAHDLRHETEEKARAERRENERKDKVKRTRWIVSTTIAGALAVATMLTFIVTIWLQIRH